MKNSTILNSFSGSSYKWVQKFAQELDVASDGTMITASQLQIN